MNIYIKNGYASRKEYLLALAEENGMDVERVVQIANDLGHEEDMESLPSVLEQYAQSFGAL